MRVYNVCERYNYNQAEQFRLLQFKLIRVYRTHLNNGKFSTKIMNFSCSSEMVKTTRSELIRFSCRCRVSTIQCFDITAMP